MCANYNYIMVKKLYKEDTVLLFMNEQNLLLKKATYLMNKRVMCHIKTNKSIFYNGHIRSIDFPEVLIFEDRFLGELPIYFEEIESIQPYKVRKVGE